MYESAYIIWNPLTFLSKVTSKKWTGWFSLPYKLLDLPGCPLSIKSLILGHTVDSNIHKHLFLGFDHIKKLTLDFLTILWVWCEARYQKLIFTNPWLKNICCCCLIGVGLEHARMGRQLEGAKPYWVDGHLQRNAAKKDWNQVSGKGKKSTLMTYHLTMEEFYGGFQVSNGHKHVLEMAVKFEPES